MATNTSKTYLYSCATETGTYAKLLDITSFPDLGSAPPKLDVTTLTDTQHKYIADIADVPDLVFGALYTAANYAAVVALTGATKWYEVRFGDSDGIDGKFRWSGDIYAVAKGGAVGAVREMEVTCYPATAITKI